MGVASQPELSIVNLSCGAFYVFNDLDYSLKSVIGLQPTYRFDTVYVKDANSENTYMYIDTTKTGVESYYMPMAIDSIHYFTDEIDQDYETHAEIFF